MLRKLFVEVERLSPPGVSDLKVPDVGTSPRKTVSSFVERPHILASPSTKIIHGKCTEAKRLHMLYSSSSYGFLGIWTVSVHPVGDTLSFQQSRVYSQAEPNLNLRNNT